MLLGFDIPHAGFRNDSSSWWFNLFSMLVVSNSLVLLMFNIAHDCGLHNQQAGGFIIFSRKKVIFHNCLPCICSELRTRLPPGYWLFNSRGKGNSRGGKVRQNYIHTYIYLYLSILFQHKSSSIFTKTNNVFPKNNLYLICRKKIFISCCFFSEIVDYVHFDARYCTRNAAFNSSC